MTGCASRTSSLLYLLRPRFIKIELPPRLDLGERQFPRFQLLRTRREHRQVPQPPPRLGVPPLPPPPRDPHPARPPPHLIALRRRRAVVPVGVLDRREFLLP